MLIMHAPPVVHDDIEDGENNDEESGGPLGLESERNHDTGRKTNERKDDTGKCPFTLESNSNEQEDQEDTTS